MMLCRLGRGAEARARLAALPRRRAGSAAALLVATSHAPSVAGADADPDRALDALNALYRKAGLAPLVRRDPGKPMALDNLHAPGVTPREGPPVTVIVPLYNGATTVATALRGLTDQSHASLEILVVDDASTDAGPEIVADLAHADPRIRLIRQAENLGGYAARNRALAEATGAFVTVHDADDWSHPEKIARHLAAARNGAPYTLSDWTRATDDLAFWGPWRPSPAMVAENISSACFRRDLIDRVGPWDTARVSADREFILRLDRLFGTAPQPVFLPGVPLAFGRDGAGSLTRASATHAATQLHGLRREYREAAEHWHATLDPDGPMTGAPPFFPAPRTIRSRRELRPRHDLLFIADFNLRGGAFHSAFNMLRAGLAAGYDCAVLHYRRYDLDPTRPLDAEFRRFANEKAVRIVAPGERLAAETVIVTYPAVFDHMMDRFPDVTHDRLAVVVNQMAERDVAGTDRAYDPGRVRAHLAEVFGSEGTWIPNSGRVRELMAADPRYPAPHPDIWTPLRDLAAWCAAEPVWRGGTRARPVLGRHGRDHPLKWPVDPAMLRAAYCADKPCEVRFLGGAYHARRRLRRWPGNWQVEAFGSRDVQAFLGELDVFLHYPDPAYVEEFGGAAMEAMAVGVPAILPPEFEPIYGPAALYAGPEDVWPLVDRLWRDRDLWQARARAGRDFVAARCDYASFPGRLARLAGRDAGAMSPAAAEA
jgi:glycosyltransferase involved in cell wall biosynthesis